MTFDNMVARVRRIDENIQLMLDAIDALKGEKDSLEASILTVLADHPELYNVYIRKNVSAGMVGRNLFKVTFSTSLSRLGEHDRLDEQEWLATIESRYIRTKMELDKSAIRSDYKAGELTDATLRTMRLHYVDKARLLVSHSPDDSEVAALVENAENNTPTAN